MDDAFDVVRELLGSDPEHASELRTREQVGREIREEEEALRIAEKEDYAQVFHPHPRTGDHDRYRIPPRSLFRRLMRLVEDSCFPTQHGLPLFWEDWHGTNLRYEGHDGTLSSARLSEIFGANKPDSDFKLHLQRLEYHGRQVLHGPMDALHYLYAAVIFHGAALPPKLQGNQLYVDLLQNRVITVNEWTAQAVTVYDMLRDPESEKVLPPHVQTLVRDLNYVGFVTEVRMVRTELSPAVSPKQTPKMCVLYIR